MQIALEVMAELMLKEEAPEVFTTADGQSGKGDGNKSKGRNQRRLGILDP